MKDDFIRNDEKWPASDSRPYPRGPQEKQSRSILLADYPADEIDQPTLTESGIVFVASVLGGGINA